jgi:hypothetical protein
MGLYEEWRRIASECHEEDLRAMLNVLENLSPKAIKTLLKFVKVYQHMGCSKVAQICGWDKGNFNKCSEKHLLFKLCVESESFCDIAKRDILSFLGQEHPHLMTKQNPQTLFRPRMPAGGEIFRALQRKDEGFLSRLGYDQIAPPTGRFLAAKAPCKLDIAWLQAFVEERLCDSQHPQASVTVTVFCFALFHPQPSERWVWDLIPRLWRCSTEYVFSAIAGLSYNPFVLEGVANQMLRSDLFAIVINNWFLRQDPKVVAKAIAEFEEKRLSSVREMFDRLVARIVYLTRAFVQPQNISALLLLDLMPIMAMPLMDGALVLDASNLVLPSIRGVEHYSGIKKALEWVEECRQELAL